MNTKVIGTVKKVGVLMALLLLWQLVFYLTTSVFQVWRPFMVPNPLDVIRVFGNLAGNNTLFIAISASMRRVLIGFFMSIAIGALLGLLIYRVKFLNDALKPVFLGLQTLPSICWLPFAILWFGLNETAIIFVIIIGSAFSIALAVEAAVKGVTPLFIKAGKTMGATPLKMLLYIIFPDCLPHVIVGLKQGWSFSWRALMNGEMLSATVGLGQVLMLGRDFADINQVMCVIIVIMVLGMLVDQLFFGIIEKKMRRDRGIV